MIEAIYKTLSKYNGFVNDVRKNMDGSIVIDFSGDWKQHFELDQIMSENFGSFMSCEEVVDGDSDFYEAIHTYTFF